MNDLLGNAENESAKNALDNLEDGLSLNPENVQIIDDTVQINEQQELTDNPNGRNTENTASPLPLISCIMPTSGRAACVAQSLQMFLEQDYPNKELIIVYNRPSDLPGEWRDIAMADFPVNVKLVKALTKVVGAKRNEACRNAVGAIIAHWDDDDIYNTDRLSIQAAPILERKADITGLQNFVFFEAASARSWQPARNKFRELYEGNVHGGSLVYNAAIWWSIAKYSNLSVGEDAAFLKKALKHGQKLRLLGIDGLQSFVYVRHATNAWHVDNRLFKDSNWSQVSLPKWAWEYAPFYEEMARAQEAVHS